MNSLTTETLADALPREMERVRELIPQYQSIGAAGTFAIVCMRQDLLHAAAAIADQNTVEMIRAYQALKGYKS